MRSKLILLAGVITLALAPLATAQTTNIKALSSGLQSFVDNTTLALPLAASAGTDWSNAYIGQLIDTDFPWVHLGVGLTAGVTSLPNKAVNPLLEAMGQSDVSSVGIPFTDFNLRLGGIVWPFDMGLKIGFLPSAFANASGFAFTYNSFGVDVRYSLVKSDLLLPDVSVGGGINYISAAVTGSYGKGITYTDPVNSANTLSIGAPTMNLKLSAVEFEGKVQVSKTLLFLLTPYAGLTASYGSAHAEAGVNSTITSNQPISYWVSQYGVPGLTTSGFGTSGDAGVFGMKIYGGSSIDILIVKFDFQGMYSLFDGNYGLSAGVRVQL